MTYSETIQNLATNLITYFDKVYHSAEIIVSDTQVKLPAVPINDEWFSLAPSDQSETVYIRRNGDDEVMEDLKLSSCVKSYKMRSSLRIVYFKDNAKNFAEILHNFTQSCLVVNTKLNRIIRDKWRLQKDESSGNYNFGATTAYFAIDIYALWELKSDTCEDLCLTIDNPLKKC
jgi:hypothetical protein